MNLLLPADHLVPVGAAKMTSLRRDKPLRIAAFLAMAMFAAPVELSQPPPKTATD